MEVAMDLLARITELRDARKWTNYEMAKKSNLSQSTVTNLYVRLNEPSVTTIESLCGGFGISLAEFFNIDGESTILTQEQKDLLFEWAKLSEEQKQSIYQVIKCI
jgi:transcriptional regulator with XRE-family HTH domain